MALCAMSFSNVSAHTVQEMRSLLLFYARTNQTATYLQFAHELEAETYELPLLFRVVSQLAAQMLSETDGLLISAPLASRTGWPGTGFFKQAAELTLIAEDADAFTRRKFVEDQRRRLAAW